MKNAGSVVRGLISLLMLILMVALPFNEQFIRMLTQLGATCFEVGGLITLIAISKYEDEVKSKIQG